MRTCPSIRPAATALSVVLIAFPALAQDGGSDWDLLRDSRGSRTTALVAYDNGLAIMVRCNRHAYEAVIMGLPPAEGPTRTLRIAMGDTALEEQSWNVAVDNTLAVSDFPAPFARELRTGGQLRVVIPGGGGNGRNLRYDLTLPASNAAIDETLTACERPLVDPRDAEIRSIGEDGLPEGVDWVIRPRPSFPADIDATQGFTVLTCLNNPDGTLRDCVVETEHPPGAGFGEAALRATGNARLGSTATPDEPLPIRHMTFRVKFVVEGYDPRRRRELPTGSRLPLASPAG